MFCIDLTLLFVKANTGLTHYVDNKCCRSPAIIVLIILALKRHPLWWALYSEVNVIIIKKKVTKLSNYMSTFGYTNKHGLLPMGKLDNGLSVF